MQCALAAGLAWWVAKDVIHHGTPFFAPIAAVVSLGLSLGARLRRSVELVCGVTVGIGVGDLIVSLIGSGPWQIALVVAMAMATAVALNSGPIFAIQAGNSAVLVATLLPPGEAGGFDRMVDALVGGLVGVAVVALVPTHPVRRARRNAAANGARPVGARCGKSPKRVLAHICPAASNTPADRSPASRTLVLNRARGDVPDALRAAEVRFARFFNNTPVAIATVDRKGRPRSRILHPYRYTYRYACNCYFPCMCPPASIVRVDDRPGVPPRPVIPSPRAGSPTA